MPILSRLELEARMSANDLAQLADMTASGIETTGMVDGALSDAEAEVMGYVRSIVNPALLPDPAPDLLKRLVCDVARYNLFQRHIHDDHPVIVAYRQSLTTLRDISSGKLALPLLDPATTSAAPAGYAPTRYLTDAAMAALLP